MNSGIDIASILNKFEENFEEEENIEDVGIENLSKKSSNSLNSLDIPVISNAKRNSLIKDQNHITNEQKSLLKELEASSKGRVEGSLIVNYLKSAQKPYTLLFLIVTFLLSQSLASFADISISIW